MLLKRFRRAAGLTQEELAERAELSVEAISALERGVSRAPHKDTVALLADALALSAQDRALFEAAARKRDDGTAPLVAEGLRAQPGGSPSQFVGRARELAIVERHLAGKGPPVLLLAGEPGIGKSRLLRESVARARANGWAVLQGGCHRRGGQEPYTPLLEALQSRIHGQSPAQLRTDLQHCGWLARLLPELVDMAALPAPRSSLPPEQERRLMFGAVGRFLANVAGPAGTLLALDDVQWADSDALDLLSTLIRTMSDTPLRVVAAYRDTELTAHHALTSLLGDLARAGVASLCRLGPLTEQEAGELLSSLLDGQHSTEPALHESVLRRAGGVPFYLVSCVQWLQNGGATDGNLEDVPWDVAETIRQRVAALPEEAHELLAAAAVVDHRATRATLISVVMRPGWSEESILQALDAACRARLLAEVGDDSYQFAHNIIREVVWADLGSAHRAALHRRVAEALEHAPTEVPAEVLAYHLMRCGEREKAVVYLERVADRAQAMYANTAAEHYYRDLVARQDELGHTIDGARAREKLGAMLRINAHYDEALDVLERAVQAYRVAGSREGQRQALAHLGRVHARRGTPDAGIARIQSFLNSKDAGESSPGTAALFIALADLYYASGRYREQLAAAERAGSVARALGDDRLLTQAEQWRSTALLTLGRAEEAIPALEEVIPQAEALGDLSSHLHALNHVALAYIQRGEFATSRSYIDRALTVAEMQGDPVQIAFMTYNRGMLEVYTGEWKQARADFERAAAMMRQIAMAWTSAYPLLGLGQLCLAEGHLEASARYLQEAITLAERSNDLQALQYALAALVERDLLEGRPEVARARLDRLLDRQTSSRAESSAHILALLAWTHMEMGDLAQAQELAAQSAARAVTEQNRLSLVESLRVRAMLMMRQGRWQEAEASLDEALSLTRAMPCAYNEARVLYLYGLLDAERGNPNAARVHLETAAAILDLLGERLYAEFVENALARVRHT